MASEIVMPKLSDTMTEGVFGSWKKSVGDTVQRGEVLAEVETDKAVMDLEAFSSGVLLEQRVHAGELVQVGRVIGLIGSPGEAAIAASTKLPDTPVSQFGIGPERVMEQPVVEIPQPVLTEHEHHDGLAAPVVRRKAREMGIDLALVAGSGSGGRVLLEDLERLAGVSPAEVPPPEEASPTAATTPQSAAGPTAQLFQGEQSTSVEQPLSRMRGAIARTVEQAWRTIPHFYETIEVDMDAVMEVRRELKLSGTPVSVNDLVIKASALALVKYPQVNASFAGDRIVLHQEINIGIAVSLPEGLLVPVLKGCEGVALKEISSRSRRILERARAGQLSEVELSGGTFSISNLGMYGVTGFSAVIHPSQAAILAVGAVREAVVAKKGQPMVGKVMNLTLSADHRLLDGAYAAEFLKELKHNLELPVRLLI